MHWIKLSVVGLGLVLVSVASASSATITGRIAYIDAKTREIMLDNNDLLTVSPAVDLSSLAVALQVRLDVTTQNGRQVVTALKPII